MTGSVCVCVKFWIGKWWKAYNQMQQVQYKKQLKGKKKKKQRNSFLASTKTLQASQSIAAEPSFLRIAIK